MAPAKQARQTKLRHIAPLFVVEDVVASANYYRDSLGFEFERFWGDPPCFVILHKDGAYLMLQSTSDGRAEPNRARSGAADTWDAYVWIDGVDDYYKDIVKKGVNVVSEPCDTFYGNREIQIEDCNGYRICFGEDLESESDGK